MNYPCLVPKRLCRTKIQVHLESEEITNLGKPRYTADLELTCNFQDKAKTILTAEKKLVQITGTALFPGDIAPDMPSSRRRMSVIRSMSCFRLMVVLPVVSGLCRRC